jgi:hypothetical protein
MSKKRLQRKKREKHLTSKVAYRRSFIVTRSAWILVILFFLCFLQKGSAQDFEVSASNQLEYSLDSKNHEDIFHNWFDFSWSYGLYNVGLRHEAHQPDDWGKTYQALSYRYFQLSSESFELTVGNYYEMFGHGLILRSYENRDLRVDNNLDGIKATIERDYFNLTFLGGTPRGGYERVDNPLQGADGGLTPVDWMTLGGSYLRTNITGYGFVRLYGGNLGFVFPHLDLYGEYARRDSVKEKKERPGDAIYLSSNLFFTGFGITLEYKDYDRFEFTHGEVTYNNPPSLTKEHQYTLLNRHAYVLSLDGEKGFQVEATSTPHQEFSLLANYSRTTDQKDKMTFSEIYAEAEYDYKDLATIKTGFSRMETKKEEGTPVFLAPVFDFTYYLSEQNSVALVLEHLSTDKYDGDLTYYDQIISLTFSHSPVFSLTLTQERTTEWKTRVWSGKKSWFITTLDWAMSERHTFSLSIGSRRAGKVCAGGVCTDRPALDGGEIKLWSQF